MTVFWKHSKLIFQDQKDQTLPVDTFTKLNVYKEFFKEN